VEAKETNEESRGSDDAQSKCPMGVMNEVPMSEQVGVTEVEHIIVRAEENLDEE
jgi:hypothetical protein